MVTKTPANDGKRMVYACEMRERAFAIEYSVRRLKRLLENMEMTTLEKFVINEAVESVENSITYLKREAEEKPDV